MKKRFNLLINIVCILCFVLFVSENGFALAPELMTQGNNGYRLMEALKGAKLIRLAEESGINLQSKGRLSYLKKLLEDNSKGIFYIEDFLKDYIDKVRLGYSLGLTNFNSYTFFSEIMGLINWELGYERWLEDRHYDKDYMDIIIETREPIVFFIPSDLGERKGYTQDEMLCLFEDLNSLENVYFVFGSYDYFKEIEKISTEVDLNSIDFVQKLQKDIPNIKEIISENRRYLKEYLHLVSLKIKEVDIENELGKLSNLYKFKAVITTFGGYEEFLMDVQNKNFIKILESISDEIDPELKGYLNLDSDNIIKLKNLIREIMKRMNKEIDLKKFSDTDSIIVSCENKELLVSMKDVFIIIKAINVSV
jgi:hypothetical protein